MDDATLVRIGDGITNLQEHPHDLGHLPAAIARCPLGDRDTVHPFHGENGNTVGHFQAEG